MRAGVECEIYVEELERWIAASILKLNLVHVPNTDLVIKNFQVKYLYATDEEFEVDPDSGKETLEDEVRSDRLRLLVDENLMTREMKEQAQAEAKVESERDENTGIGGWATVSVSVYNEEEEEAKRVEAEQKVRAEQELSRQRKIDFRDAEMEDTGEALSIYDPNNTGMYKGVRLGNEVVEQELISLAKGANVSFKKRKTGSGSGTINRKAKMKISDHDS